MGDFVTLITGASSGIGRHLAHQALGDSRTLVLVARRRERLEELAEELEAEAARRSSPLDTLVLDRDLTDPGARRSLVEELEGRGLALDHLVNNAGFGVADRFHQVDPDRERGMVELNVTALHDLMVRFVPGMAARGYGRVLNVASTAAFQPMPHMATYAATKAFVLSLTEALWAEYRGTGVSFTALCPGKTETEFFEEANMEGASFAKMPGDDPRQVAAAGWKAMMAGERVEVTGLQNKIGAALAPRMPRRLILALTGKMFEQG